MKGKINGHLVTWIALGIILISNILLIGRWTGGIDQKVASMQQQLDRVEQLFFDHITKK